MSGVPWHSPLGGLIEARGVLRVARKSVENEKAINGHIAGNPYDVAISALNFALGSLDGIITPAQGLDAATNERCAQVAESWSDPAFATMHENRCFASIAAAIRALNTASTTTRGEKNDGTA